jgi:hypothetical protein
MGGFGMGGPGGGGVFGLAGNPVVQNEIGLEGEGAAKVQKVVDSFRQEMTGEMEKAGLGFGGPGQFATLKPTHGRTHQGEHESVHEAPPPVGRRTLCGT